MLKAQYVLTQETQHHNIRWLWRVRPMNKWYSTTKPFYFDVKSGSVAYWLYYTVCRGATIR